MKLKCKKGCGKIISSSYLNQARYNLKLHEMSCKGPVERKEKKVKRVCACGRAFWGYTVKQAESDLERHRKFIHLEVKEQ